MWLIAGQRVLAKRLNFIEGTGGIYYILDRE
jgi:hypothetical protein